MNKRNIMLGTFAFNLLILLSFLILKYIGYPLETIEKNMRHISVAQQDNRDIDEYINLISNLADEIDDDVMIRVINADYSMDYYRTTTDSHFINLDGVDNPYAVYSTHPVNGEEKIKGFFLKDDKFRIIPISFLGASERDLSALEFIVREDKINLFSDFLNSNGCSVSTGAGVSVENDFSQLYLLICIFDVFLVVSVIVYSFSRSKEFVVRRIMGYGKKDIIISELKKNASFFMLILGGILIIFFIVASMIFDVSSTLLFIEKNLIYFGIYTVLCVFFLSLSVMVVALRCSVLDIKGKSLNRDLFAVTAVFKTVMIFFLSFTLTDLGEAELNMIRSLRTAKQASELTEGFAATTINVLIEKPFDNPEKYAPVFLDFYNQLKSERKVVIADFSSVSDENMPDNHSYEESHNHQDIVKLPRVVINDVYLDINDTVFDTNGNRIDASYLKEDKYNFLVPEDADTDSIESIYTRNGAFKSDELNYIYYAADKSRFFTYSNNISGMDSCFAENVIAVVYNPDFEYEHQDTRTFSAFMESYISSCFFFEYDTESDQSPLEQILPVIKNTGTDKIIISTPRISDVFYEWISSYKNLSIFNGVKFAIALISFLVLLVYTTELYYRNYSKDISLKQINGFSFARMFSYRMILKMMIIPAMLISGKVNVYVALLCSAAEIIIFIVCINKNMKKNLTVVLKGE